jgi:uncharacterized protein (TIGR03083 family)
VDVAFLIEQLTADGAALADAVSGRDWDAPVPRTEWNLRQLVTHLGGVQRWAAEVVETRSPTGATPAGEAVGSGPGDDELLEWFREGHETLVETLSSAPDDLDCFTFLPADSALHFWARRQAHEQAIHRADADGATGREAAIFDADFAQDGLAELLTGFARRRSNAVARAGTLGLDAVDGASWLITFGGERIEAVETEDLASTDVTVRGLSSDLYLWAWNRPSDAAVDGDDEIAALWGATVQISWS